MDKMTSNQVYKMAPAADLFAPRAVAVVGASAEAHAVTARPLRFLEAHGFRGRIYAVNPRHRQIGDIACYPSVADLPERPDAALVGVSAARLETAVADCAAAGVPLISVFTAAVGGDVKQRILDTARRSGSRILGPNSLGFIDAHEKVFCTYSQAALLPRIPAGALSIISQSGGLGGCLLNRVADAGIGVARFLTPGAGIDIGVTDLIEDLAASPSTRAVAAIVESVGDGVRFVRAIEKLHDAGKRLVIWHIGQSASGRVAAVSHTGALAGDGRVFAALCRDLGVAQVDTLDELLETAAACTARRPPAGRSVGIVTSSGGAAIMVADALEAEKLAIPAPSPATVETLRRALPPTASIANPLDLGAGQGPETFGTGLRTMLADPAFDCTVLALTMVAGDQAEQVVPELIRSTKDAERPLAVVWPAGSLAASWRRRLRRHGIAVFERPDCAAAALRRLRQAPRGATAGIRGPSARASEAAALVGVAAGVRPEWRVRQLLSLYGIDSPAEVLVHSVGEAVDAARRIGFPVALKAQSPRLPHRARAGALYLDLADAGAVARACGLLLAGPAREVGSDLDGILVQAMVRPEHEVFVGMVRDPTFGPVIACGEGGGGVEESGEIGFVLPSDDADAFAAWLEGQPLGARIGTAGRASIAGVLVKLSRIVADLDPRLAELDVNPVALVAGGTRALALDALAVIADAGEAARSTGTTPAPGAAS